MYYSGINAFVWCLTIAMVAIAVYYATQEVISWLSWREQCKENADQAFFYKIHFYKLSDRVTMLEKQLGVENENKECNADKEVLNEKEGEV